MHEHGQPLEAGKVRKEMDVSLEPLEGMQPCKHLEFCPVRPIPDYGPPELQENKFLLT